MAKKRGKTAPRAVTKKRSLSAGKVSQRPRKGGQKRATKPAAKKQPAKSASALQKTARELDRAALELEKATRSTQGRRVVVLFADDIVVSQKPGWKGKPGRWEELRHRYGIETIVPMFADAELVDRLERHGREINREYPWPRFRNYFRLYLRSAGRAGELVRELRTWKGIVRRAYEDSAAIPASSGSAQACFTHSGHVDPAPVGINAACAWQFVGGLGEGQSCIDVESGWNPGHIRLAHLAPPSGTLLCGSYELGGIKHGTCVLGTICGTNPVFPAGPHVGCDGIAPGVADVRLASYVPESEPPSVDTIYSAVSAGIDFLRGSGGGVLLLEYQTADLLPLEVLPAMRDLIESAKPDVTVVQAAGNGKLDLDGVPGDLGDFPLLRAPEAPDSGAIMVGAAHSAVVGGEHERYEQNRRSGSNFGSRLDCYAWGEDIGTPTAGGAGDLCTSFGGTSGAAAIIAGVALVVRGIAQAGGQQLDAAALRDLLSDENLGTRCTASARIGSMPDLAQIVAHLGPLQLR